MNDKDFRSVWNSSLHPKLCLILFLCSGNFMYFVGYSKWLLLGSRLVAGDIHKHMHTHTNACQNTSPKPRNSIDVPFSFPLSGVGAGAGSSIFGFLTRCTRPEERAGIFAAIMACRQAGLLVGKSQECHRHNVRPWKRLSDT